MSVGSDLWFHLCVVYGDLWMDFGSNLWRGFECKMIPHARGLHVWERICLDLRGNSGPLYRCPLDGSYVHSVENYENPLLRICQSSKTGYLPWMLHRGCLRSLSRYPSLLGSGNKNYIHFSGRCRSMIMMSNFGVSSNRYGILCCGEVGSTTLNVFSQSRPNPFRSSGLRNFSGKKKLLAAAVPFRCAF